MWRAALALGLLPVLAACGPVPVAQAERLCRDQVAVPGPRLGGAARLGATFGPEGARIERRMDLDITMTHRAGGEEAWRACVLRESGRLPARPYRP